VVPQNFPLFVGDLGDGQGQAAGVLKTHTRSET